MAIDQNPSTSQLDPEAAEVIDNELPAYRAISPGSVLSLVLGCASVFCFTDPLFLIVVAAAVVVGLLSIRKIKRLPEVLTGTSFARAGIGLSLLFGISAVTHTVASDFLITRDASRFARTFTEVIKTQPVEVTLWYQETPEIRRAKKLEEIVAEIKKVKSPITTDHYKDRVAGATKIKERLKGPGETIRFARIETKAVDGLTIHANALIELDGPGSPEFPDKEQFALLEMTKAPGAGPDDWVIKEVVFPYKQSSVVAVIQKKTDDGHGH